MLTTKPLRIAFDIGGVLSKFPDVFRALIPVLIDGGVEIHVITDMHDREDTLRQLAENGFGMIPPERVHNSDYTGLGEFCKAILLKRLGIDVLIDDFGGYVQWDSQLGPAPLRLLVAPDGFRPYWHPSWKCGGGEFGRRCAPLKLPADDVHLHAVQAAEKPTIDQALDAAWQAGGKAWNQDPNPDATLGRNPPVADDDTLRRVALDAGTPEAAAIANLIAAAPVEPAGHGPRCPECAHLAHNQADCVWCTCEHQCAPAEVAVVRAKGGA